jgi:hypothetical protein
MDIEAISAHIEIRQALVRYCRGVDRGDEDLILSAYHPGAMDRHGTLHDAPAEDFAKHVLARFDRPKIVGQHHLTNTYIDLRGDVALVESYFLGFRPAINEATGEDELVPLGGRYLDRFEKREIGWRIAERLVVVDWFHKPWSKGEIEREHRLPFPGRREKDPSYDFFRVFPSST